MAKTLIYIQHKYTSMERNFHCPDGNGTAPVDDFDVSISNWKKAKIYDPYPVYDEDVPVEQHIIATVKYGDCEMQVDLFYAPNYGELAYVVRAETAQGRKSKDVYPDPSGLFIKSRAVPWDTDKQWTYLNYDQCRQRAKIAGIGPVKASDNDRYKIYVQEGPPEPLYQDEMLNHSLVKKLAKLLIVFQTRPQITNTLKH